MNFIKPNFIQAAEERARQYGCSVEEVVRGDEAELDMLDWPGPDCLQTHELEAIAHGQYPDPYRLAHATICAPCNALLQSVEAKKTHPAT